MKLVFAMAMAFTSMAAAAADHPVKTIELSTNVKLQYVEQGNANGTPVIFLHGITDSWHSFESVLKHLPKNIHAFAISQRGHGDSERPVSGYHPKDFANDVAAFIKKKNLGKAVVVGHSMGGVVAQQFVLLHPQLAKGIVIIDSDPTFIDNPGMPEFYQEVMKLQGAIDYKFMDEFQKATLTKPIDPEYYETLVVEGTKVPAWVFQAAMKGIVEVDFAGQLKSIKAPVLIFWGDKDAFCTRDGQDTFIKNIPNSRLIVYEGTGHALHWEEPARFVKDLIGFINGLK
jgi:non-heme chloroperoxidase